MEIIIICKPISNITHTIYVLKWDQFILKQMLQISHQSLQIKPKPSGGESHTVENDYQTHLLLLSETHDSSWVLILLVSVIFTDTVIVQRLMLIMPVF